MTTSFDKEIYAVDDYFNLTSEMPQYLIQRKVATAAGNDGNPSPLQITMMVNNKQIESPLEAEKNPLNLRTIGEELDRVSNRLAHKNTTQASELRRPEVPELPTKATSTTAVERLLQNLLPQMDETIISINTTSKVTGAVGNRLVKLYIISNSTNYHFNQDWFISSTPKSRPNDTNLVDN